MRKLMRGGITGALAVAVLAACGDDPLSADRTRAEYIQLNPSVATVAVDGQTVISAVVMNYYNAPIGVAVTGTACNARITAEVDPGRSIFEPPERFIVHGESAGASCLEVRGGGITDTVVVTVVVP